MKHRLAAVSIALALLCAAPASARDDLVTIAHPDGGTFRASLTSRVACNGFWIVGDYEQRRDDAVVFQGHSVFGFDQQAQEVTLYWFDTMGMPADAFRGKFEGTKLTLTAKNAMGQHRLTYDFADKAKLRSKMETSQDGKQWIAMFDGVYTHKK